MGTSFERSDVWDRLSEQALVMICRWYSQQPLTIKRNACPPSDPSLNRCTENLTVSGGLLLEWIPQNHVGHLMFITQRYTLFHATLYILSEFIGQENGLKSEKIRVGYACARKIVEYRV